MRGGSSLPTLKANALSIDSNTFVRVLISDHLGHGFIYHLRFYYSGLLVPALVASAAAATAAPNRPPRSASARAIARR